MIYIVHKEGNTVKKGSEKATIIVKLPPESATVRRRDFPHDRDRDITRVYAVTSACGSFSYHDLLRLTPILIGLPCGSGLYFDT